MTMMGWGARSATYAGTPDDNGQAVLETFTYDGNGNLIRYVDQRRVEFAYTYDNLDRKLTETLVESVSNAGAPLILAAYEFDDVATAEGLYAVLERDANNNITTQQYDLLDRITIATDRWEI